MTDLAGFPAVLALGKHSHVWSHCGSLPHRPAQTLVISSTTASTLVHPQTLTNKAVKRKAGQQQSNQSTVCPEMRMCCWHFVPLYDEWCPIDSDQSLHIIKPEKDFNWFSKWKPVLTQCLSETWKKNTLIGHHASVPVLLFLWISVLWSCLWISCWRHVSRPTEHL